MPKIVLIVNPITTVVVIKKKPGIKKLVTFVERVSSTSTANKIVGCAGITKLTFNVCTIAMKTSAECLNSTQSVP